MPKKKPKRKIDGDKIDIRGLGSKNIIAAGRNAVAKVTNLFNITIVGDVKLLPVVFTLVGVIALLSFLFLQLKPSNCADKMAGGFNIAVAEFTVEDENGKEINDPGGIELGNFLYERVTTNLSELNLINSIINRSDAPRT